MKSLVASALVISALTLPPAAVLAQSDSDTGQNSQQSESMSDQNGTQSGDAVKEEGTSATGENAAEDDSMSKDDESLSEEEMDNDRAAETAGDRGDFVTAQTSEQTLSENYIGASVLIGSGEERESVGTISELIFDDSDAITGAVVDVGGFLGLGAKPVGLQWSALEQVRAEETVAFTTSLTREELENAPEFKTLDEQAAEEPVSEEGTTTTN